MKTIEFSININASKEKVWDMLWSDAGYKKWTAIFAEGSYAETDWKEGSKIRFLTPDGSGMYGFIQKLVPFEQMHFRHEGELKNGIEEKKEWAGATEKYYLKEENGATLLKTQMDTTPEFEGYFSETMPKALAVLKEISEQ